MTVVYGQGWEPRSWQTSWTGEKGRGAGSLVMGRISEVPRWEAVELLGLHPSLAEVWCHD